MSAKIPLFTLATTLTAGCSVDPTEKGKEMETETAAENEEENNEENNDTDDSNDTEEPEDTGDNETESPPTINGEWSLSSSEESCHESYETFCGQFTEFTMGIENEELSSSNIVFTSVYENETYIETLILESFSGEDGGYSISLGYGNISFGLDCILSDEELECSGSRPDYELGLQATLTK